MTLTRRGRVATATAAGALAFLAGATAQHWDPYTRQVDACQVRACATPPTPDAVAQR